MAASGYEMWGETIGNKYVDLETQDWYPFHNQWRSNPLDVNRPWIKDNSAGLYPYVKTRRVMKNVPEKDWKFEYYYVCSTIFPVNPQFKANREIILER